MTEPSEGPSKRRPQQQRKQVLLRLDPSVYEALARWASDELRSANAQIEFLLRKALKEAGGCRATRGRCPAGAGPRGRRTAVAKP
ncbi:hypothetical protein GCM10020295_29070 [Streptomyces cinereospinus]